jgi:prephenate dehydratase
MEFDSKKQFDEVINEIQPLTEALKILGVYKSAKK